MAFDLLEFDLLETKAALVGGVFGAAPSGISNCDVATGGFGAAAEEASDGDISNFFCLVLVIVLSTAPGLMGAAAAAGTRVIGALAEPFELMILLAAVVVTSDADRELDGNPWYSAGMFWRLSLDLVAVGCLELLRGLRGLDSKSLKSDPV